MNLIARKILELDQVAWRQLGTDLLGTPVEAEAECIAALRQRLRRLETDDDPEA